MAEGGSHRLTGFDFVKTQSFILRTQELDAKGQAEVYGTLFSDIPPHRVQHLWGGVYRLHESDIDNAYFLLKTAPQNQLERHAKRLPHSRCDIDSLAFNFN